MSYIYDALKTALGGASFKGGTVSKNWSPNEVRSIVLMRDFILVADFLKAPKVVPLDYNELSSDLSNPNRRGYLNKILLDRQLSCMEEIYVDEAYIRTQGVIDLDEYVKSAINTKSRLRYYGYVSGMNAGTLQSLYVKALSEGDMNFTLARSMGGFRYNDTNNTTWYKNHNLRDQFYELDKPNGRLAVYFKKCEATISEELKSREEQAKMLGKAMGLISMVKVDLGVFPRVLLLKEYGKFLSRLDIPWCKKFGESLQMELVRKKPCKGLTKKDLVVTLSETEMPRNPELQRLVKFYEKVGVYDDTSGKVLDQGEGIYGLCTRLSDALIAGLHSNLSGDEWALWKLALLMSKELPNCEFVSEVMKRVALPINILEVNSQSTGLLIDFVYRLGGLSEDNFRQSISIKEMSNNG